jgi:hypothetical protein
MTVGERSGGGSVRSVLGLVLLSALLLAGCASKGEPTATAGATAPGTATIKVQPFDRSGQLSVQVAGTVRGQCWTTSIAAPNARAYRCFQGNKILDPCFAPAHVQAPVQLACLPDPWSRAVMLRVNGKLPVPSTGNLPTRPWAFALSNGTRCVASTGTVPEVAGTNLAYHCADGGNAALGGPDGDTLTAQYAGRADTSLTSMTVTTVWNA